MQKRFIRIHAAPAASSQEMGAKEESTRRLYELVGCMSRICPLLDRALDILGNPESCDYIEEVPALMGELYTLYLRIGAIRKQCSFEGISDSVVASLEDVWEAQAAAGAYLDRLANLFDEAACFGDENEDDGREDSCDEGEDGYEEEDLGDHLCTVSILLDESVPSHIADSVYASIEAVLDAIFYGDPEHRKNEESCGGDCPCGCSGGCKKK